MVTSPNPAVSTNEAFNPNSPPVIGADSSLQTVNEGQTATNTGTYSDLNTSDDVTITASVGTVTKTGTNTGTWSWSFGTTDGPAQSQIVTITADDGNGGNANTTFALSVNNVSPTVSLSLSANPINENGSVTLTGTITDPGSLDSHTVAINWGDGSAPTNLSLPADTLTFTPSHQYLDDNPSGTPSDSYTIAVTVTDKDSATGSANTSITVRNLAPVIKGINGPSGFVPLGTPATVSATFTDTGTQDTHTCSFAWGDGTSSGGTVTESSGSGSCSATRTYAAAGVYTVLVTVTDDDTGSASRTVAVRVR